MPVAESAQVRLNAGDRLIVALDVPSAAEAMELVQRLDGAVSFFKVGIELFASAGPDLVKRLVDAGRRVFLDLKYFDVPETVKRAVERVASLGATFLTVHGNGKIIRAAVEGRGTSGLKLLSVTVLTSLDNDDMKEMGLNCAVKDLVLYRATTAMEAGCDGVITSVNETGQVRHLAQLKQKDPRFFIVTPGIRPEESPRDDHKRLATPSDAISAGADYLVVGRPIRRAPDPRKAAEDVIREMQRAFNAL